MRKLTVGLLAVVSLTVIQTAYAAKVLGPPVEDLLSKPDRIRIVVAEAQQKTDDGKIAFAVSERLSGEAPDGRAQPQAVDEESHHVVGDEDHDTGHENSSAIHLPSFRFGTRRLMVPESLIRPCRASPLWRTLNYFADGSRQLRSCRRTAS